MKRFSCFLCTLFISAGILLSSVPSLTLAGEKKATKSNVPRYSELSGEVEDALEGFEDDEPEEVLDGFEDETDREIDPVEQAEPEKAAFAHLSGALSLGASIAYAHRKPPPGQTDFRGLARMRPDLHLELDLNLYENWKGKISGRFFYDAAYRINGRDGYTPETLDQYEDEAELLEAYVQGSLLKNLDIKVGRQIVVWGQSDNLRVVDILNPLDNREPGLVDIEDLRLPVTMTKMDFYAGPWSLSGIAVHEIRFNKDPVFGSEFYPFSTPLPPEIKPASSWENTEYAFSLNGRFSGWDMALFLARYFDDAYHIEMPAWFEFERIHSRLTMAGLSGCIALGNWLLKTEAAYIKGLEFYGLPGETRSRFDILFGVEYSGFTDTTVTLEAVNRHIKDFDPRLDNIFDLARENTFQSVLRITGDYWHDTLHLVALISIYGLDAEGGAFERFSIGYDFTDAVTFTLGTVMYQSGDYAGMEGISDKDRLFVEAKYSF